MGPECDDDDNNQCIHMARDALLNRVANAILIARSVISELCCDNLDTSWGDLIYAKHSCFVSCSWHCP